MSSKKDRRSNKKSKKAKTLNRKNNRKNAEIIAEIEAANEVDQNKIREEWETLEYLKRYLDFIESLD